MANEFVVKNGLIVSGSARVQGSVTAQSFTGSFSGSIATATTASYALTASSVTTLNQTVLITGSLGVGVGSLGSTENTLVLGPAPAGGSGEGGQILLQAQGGTYTSASMLDNYQNKFRILRGTNASSDGYKLQLDLHTGQIQLPNYNSTAAFTGTTLVGFLGFDSSGNILTAQTSSAALAGGSTNYVARWASSATLTTGSIYDTGTNVGIGTTGPAAKLDVYSAGSGTTLAVGRATGGSSIKAGADAAGGYLALDSNGGAVIINHYSNNDIWLATAGGSVGVGTSSPGYKLDVNGTSGFRSDMYVVGTSTYWYNGTSYFQATNSSDVGILKMTNNSSPIALQPNGGNVGIGTTNPGTKLQVNGDGLFTATGYSSNGAYIAINQESASYKWAAIKFRSQGVESFFIGVDPYLANTQNFAIYDQVAGATRLYINPSGNVGIGTTNPNEKLHVAGNIHAYAAGGIDAGLFASTSGGSTTIAIRSNGITHFNGGNVGIGTTNPSLESAGTGLDILNSSYTQLRVRSNSSSAGIEMTPSTGKRWEIQANTSSKWFVYDRTDQLYRLLIDTNGNVGIGTTNPNALLVLDSGEPRFRMNIAGTNHIIMNHDGTTAVLRTESNTPFTFGTNGSERMRIAADGNVGIGTTNPIYKLQVAGSTYVNGGTLFLDSSQYLRWGNSAQGIVGVNDTSLDFLVGSAIRMTATAGGNVGIGVTTPQAKLQVSGSTNVLNVRGSGSATTSSIFSVDGNNGRLFEVSDDLSNSLFSVNTIAGLPVIEAFADYTVTMGTYGQYVLQVTGSNVGIGSSAPQATLDVNGNVRATSFTGSFSGSATNAVSASYALTASYALNAGDSVWTGSAGNIYYNGGNVGIGTTSPGAKLEVYNSGTAFANIKAGGGDYAYLQLTTPSSDNGYLIKNTATGNSALDKSLYLWNGNGPIQFVPNATIGNAVTINTSGNVGIGTTGPSAKLHVVGESKLTGAAAAYTFFDQANGTYYSVWYRNNNITYLYDSYLNSNPFVINASGNVGIGITSPNTQLHLFGTGDQAITIQSTTTGASTAAFIKHIRVTTGSARSWWTGVGIQGGTDDSYSFYDATAGAERMRIAGTGYVGIGTTNPQNKLVVTSDATYNSENSYSIAAASATNPDFKTVIGYDYANDIGVIAAVRMGVAWKNLAILPTGGSNVGIGTTNPTAKLHVVGSTYTVGTIGIQGTNVFYFDDYGGGFYMQDTSWIRTYNAKSIWTGGGYLGTDGGLTVGYGGAGSPSGGAIIAGNVGIGSSSPGYKLDVVGTARITSGLYVDEASTGAGSKQFFIGGGSYYNFFVGKQYNVNNAFEITPSTTAGGSTYSTPALAVLYNGNIGINTTSPNQKLQINSPLQTEYYGTDNASPADVANLVGTGAYRGLGTGSALLFSVPANTDGTNMWAQARILGTGDNASNGNAEGAMFLQTRALYNPGVGGSWNWRTNMVLRASGNVGIGTSNPTVKLDIVSTGGSGLRIIDSTAPNFYINNTAVQWKIYLPSGTNDFRINDAVGDYLSIKYNSGNVGIGTTNPGEKLSVNGTFSSNSLWTVGAAISFWGGYPTAYGGLTWDTGQATVYATSGNKLYLASNGSSPDMTIDTSGNVGIGITTPSVKLEVDGIIRNSSYIDAGTSGAAFRFYDGSTFRGGFGTDAWATGGSSSNLVTFVNGGNYYIITDGTNNKVVTVDSNGCVGIGTTSPAAKLDIAGNAVIQNGYNMVIGSTVANPVASTSKAALTLRKFTSGNASTVVSASYYLGVGGNEYTNGSYRLIGFGYAETSATTTYPAYIGYREASTAGYTYGDLIFGTRATTGASDDPSERMRITYEGNVGIGITNPGSKLDVDGGSAPTVARFYNLSATATQVEIGDSGNSQYSDLLLLSNSGQAEIWKSGTGYTSYGGALALNIYNSNGAIAFHPNNTANAMFIATSGNVGIGTTSPSQKLEVSGGDALIRNAFIGLIPAYGTNYASFSHTSRSTTDKYSFLSGNAGDTYINASNGYSIYFRQENIDQMTITGGGNVGIGTNSPAEKLHVVGGIIRIDSNTGGFYQYNTTGVFRSAFYDNGTVTSIFGDGDGSNSAITINSGNIGIGTTSPSGKLHVVGASANSANIFTRTAFGSFTSDGFDLNGVRAIFIDTPNSNDNLSVAYYSTGAGEYPTAMRFYSIDGVAARNSASTPYIFRTQGSTTVSALWNNGGAYFGQSVGIGTSTPAFQLDVVGTVRATTFIETSAKKYKTNIQNLEPQLNKVLQLQPVTFDWKDKKQENTNIGLIADDVINIYPEFVVKNSEDEIEGIDYSKLTAVLIQSVKELKEIIDVQQQQINALLNK